jgi:pilus assembly protein FimV
MIQRPVRSFITSMQAALAAASVALGALCWTMPGDAFAQASDPVTAGSGQTYAVKPGQSLNDIAGELTGSKDRDVREKMARALFDANPNSFGNHDINKLKLGAVLNVPATDANGGASAVEAASAPAMASAPAQAAAPASTPASMSASMPAQAQAPVAQTASEAAAAQMASQPEAAASATDAASNAEAVTHSQLQAAAASAPAQAVTDPAQFRLHRPGPIALGASIAGLFVLFYMAKQLYDAKRDKPPAGGDSRVFASREEAEADAALRNEALRLKREREASEASPDLEGQAVQRDQSELNAVAASMQSYEAAQSFATPTEDDAPASTEGEIAKPQEPAAPPEPPAAPYMPSSPASHHPSFIPPMPSPATNEGGKRESLTQEIASREADEREANKWETEERTAAARQAAAKEAEEREVRAREHAAREALARDLQAREMQLLDNEAKQAAEQEQHAEEAREAAAREIIAREAELHEAQARAAQEQATERSEASDEREDDEASPAHRFPMPKFPHEAIQALDTLEFNLPPRMELTLNLPTGPVTSSGVQPQAAPPAAMNHTAPFGAPPVMTQPVADAQHTQRAPLESVASQIEAGTAGAGSVAGLGATQFAPLSMDFDSKLPRSQTAPLPPMTPAQLAAIARNKLELAGEYIELGDLPGARTLLQEVIASNDPATRQRAATMLSTLAPHS